VLFKDSIALFPGEDGKIAEMELAADPDLDGGAG